MTAAAACLVTVAQYTRPLRAFRGSNAAASLKLYLRQGLYKWSIAAFRGSNAAASLKQTA